MKRSRLVLLFVIALIVGTNSVSAQSSFGNWIEKLFGSKDTVAVAQSHPDLAELTVDENLLIPEVNKKKKKKVVAQQAIEAKRLEAIEGYKVSTLRDEEVIHIEIPASMLFAPNDTELLPSSDGLLRALLPCLRVPDYYHMLLVMHSDNTGNNEYCYSLTTERVYSIYYWFEQNGGCIDYVIPYAAGCSEPLQPNNTIAGRAANRRLEIYLIPAEEMLK